MLYIDTSVVVALLTKEVKSPSVFQWYSSLKEIPVSSDWLLPEFSSAISIKVRTGQLSEAESIRVLNEFDVFVGGGLRLVPLSRDAIKRAGVLARNHLSGLRSGDSLHLAAALELGVSHMATLDKNQALNATNLGLELEVI